ncbi:unnamed protein product [Mytilus edulis]|uniref:DZIP3-like HEPN domain-containing protein n=1 Tax=Mytilus edulis TaxID=6550 RepID=A0A8S3R2C3_MYTED|nr:unnamed protein product [Mytilus edulis]
MKRLLYICINKNFEVIKETVLRFCKTGIPKYNGIKTQVKHLNQTGVLNSKDFDVTLMTALIRNLANLPPPTGGYDNLPLSTDTNTTADLARIKYYRNELAHINDAKVTTSFFTAAWEDISGAVRRLGGPNMEEECSELRTTHLDQSTVPLDVRGNNRILYTQFDFHCEYWRHCFRFMLLAMLR